jgi:hypothetical protein
MSNELYEQQDMLSNIDTKDILTRGVTYLNHMNTLAQTEAEIEELEYDLARAQYEHDIIKRIQNKATDPPEKADWDSYVKMTKDLIEMAEKELADAAQVITHYRAIINEIEADLGDKAELYVTILTELGWGNDDRDLDDIFCPFLDECPILGGGVTRDDEGNTYEAYNYQDDTNGLIH